MSARRGYLRPGEVELGTDDAALVESPAQAPVRGERPAHISNRSDAVQQQMPAAAGESRHRLGLQPALTISRNAVCVWSRRFHEVAVAVNQPGHDGSVGGINNLCPGRNCKAAVLDRRYPSILDDYHPATCELLTVEHIPGTNVRGSSSGGSDQRDCSQYGNNHAVATNSRTARGTRRPLALPRISMTDEL